MVGVVRDTTKSGDSTGLKIAAVGSRKKRIEEGWQDMQAYMYKEERTGLAEKKDSLRSLVNDSPSRPGLHPRLRNLEDDDEGGSDKKPDEKHAIQQAQLVLREVGF